VEHRGENIPPLEEPDEEVPELDEEVPELDEEVPELVEEVPELVVAPGPVVPAPPVVEGALEPHRAVTRQQAAARSCKART
jgi:hypothetical protein